MNLDVNLDALIEPDLDIGVPGGSELLRFSEALVGTDRLVLDAAREALENVLGAAAIPAASAIAANFSKNDRIANGLGIPHDPVMVKATKDIREQLGLNSYLSAINTLKYIPSD